MIVADTQALVWLWTGDDHLGSIARQIIDSALRNGDLAVSAITFWEVAMLRAKDRLDFPEDVNAWRRELLGQGLIEIPIDGEIGIRSNELANFHADPADRIIVATAMNGHELVTTDRRILEWPGGLRCVDAAL